MCGVTVFELHQRFCDNFGFNDQIIWDSYNSCEKDVLISKIKSIFNDDVFNKILHKRVNSVIEAIWNQKKYTGDILLMMPIFVTCAAYPSSSIFTADQLYNSKNFSTHPVFRIRKCTNINDSSSCCMIFVDENARVYQNWNEYKRNNQLPDSCVITPKNGIYNNDENNQVILESFWSPSSQTIFKIKQVAQKAATAGQVGAGFLMLATLPLSMPIAASVTACATVVGTACSALTTSQSILYLRDRNMHEQSVGITNPETRASIISIAGGLSYGAAGFTTKILTKAAANGSKLGITSKAAVNIANGSKLIINGFGVGNGFFEIMVKKRNDEKVSILQVAQLASSIFLLTHSLKNFQTASDIIKKYQNKTVYDLRADLSSNAKTFFNRIYQQALKLAGKNGCHNDLIRSTNETLLEYNNHINSTSLSNSSVISLGYVIDQCHFAINLLTSVCTTLNMNNLSDSIIDIMEILTKEALDYFLIFVSDFVKTERVSIEKLLQRFIPIEQYVKDIFEILSKKSNQQLSNFIVTNLINEKESMYEYIHNFYNNMKLQNNVQKQCPICHGYYYKK